MLELELGEDAESSRCHCCDNSSNTGYGFVYKDGHPYAVYYVAWSTHHRENGVTMAVAIGEWDDGSTAEDRTCFGLEAYEGERYVLFRFINPESSPWSQTDLLGNMIGREDALRHPRSADILAVAELIVRGHPSVRDFLRASE